MNAGTGFMRAMEDRRTALEIRTIVVSFESAKYLGGDDVVEGARARAKQLLARVAVKVEPEHDEELTGLLRDARRRIAQ